METVGTGATATKKENQGSASSSTGTSSSSVTKPNKKKTKIDANTGLECVDLDDNCPFWAATVRSIAVLQISMDWSPEFLIQFTIFQPPSYWKGDCKNNRGFMSVNCRLSCDRCQWVQKRTVFLCFCSITIIFDANLTVFVDCMCIQYRPSQQSRRDSQVYGTQTERDGTCTRGKETAARDQQDFAGRGILIKRYNGMLQNQTLVTNRIRSEKMKWKNKL